MRRYASLAVLLMFFAPVLPAQESPRAALTLLFDGMRAADTTGMTALFHPAATLRSVIVDSLGKATLTPGSIPDWLAGVAGAQPDQLDERLHHTEVRTDGRLATAWTPYTFLLNGQVHHCGTNALQLIQDESDRWRILNVIDTRYYTDCAPAPTRPAAERIAELATEWHAAAARADLEAFFGYMTDQAFYLGTDSGEHWSREEFYRFAKPYFDAGNAWSFYATERHIFYDPDQSVAYWDELLDTWMGPCRGTAVAKRVAGQWKIAHYTLSMTVPNNKVQMVIEAIEK